MCRELALFLILCACAGCLHRSSSTVTPDARPGTAARRACDCAQCKARRKGGCPCCAYTAIEEWAKAAVKRLRACSPIAECTGTTIERSDGGRGRSTYTFYGIEALIRLRNKEWVYYTAYSRHGGPELVLAIDQDGNLRDNVTHVCPHLFVTTKGKGTLGSASDFFRTTCTYHTGPAGGNTRLRWEPFDTFEDCVKRREHV